MEAPVKDEEEIAPGERGLAVQSEPQVGVGPAANEKLIDSPLGLNLPEGLLCVDDRERNQDRARPGRYLVDVEIKPPREKDDLRRDGGHRIVVVLPD